jgi:hypothetical protein
MKVLITLGQSNLTTKLMLVDATYDASDKSKRVIFSLESLVLFWLITMLQVESIDV